MVFCKSSPEGEIQTLEDHHVKAPCSIPGGIKNYSGVAKEAERETFICPCIRLRPKALGHVTLED